MIKSVAFFVCMTLCALASAQGINLWGVVTWKTGAPAVGVELRLLSGERMLPLHILTNSAGRYGLYGLSAPTSKYSLQVVRAGRPVMTVNLPSLHDGGRVPNIVLPAS
jgi:hypothetical protein